MAFDIVVIGTSAGGIDALKKIFASFKAYDKVAVIIIQHLSPSSKSYLHQIVTDAAHREAMEIEDKMPILRGGIYIVPPNYHALIEKEGYFTLTTTEKVCFARPSIDVTFESAADAFGERLLGVLLTGANHDGGAGLKNIQESGGYTVVQDPNTAEAREMPEFGIKYAVPNEVLPISEIGGRLSELIDDSGDIL